MFICPEGGSFYCKNCSDVLRDMENASRACDAPIDKSKPSKPYKKEDEVTAEEEVPKKGKKE
jgi:hypothetical protein